MFYNPQRFDFARELTAQWLVIRDELDSLTASEFHDWPEHRHYGDKGWETFGLYAFGRRQRDNCLRCPRTEMILQNVPGLMMAGYSRLAPGTHIKPHRGYEGYAGNVLRLHLGLWVPPDCGIRVGDETRTWDEGKCLVFDDSIEHEAWNRSARSRTVLLLDFLNPLRKRPLILNPKFSPEMINFIDQERSKQSLMAQLRWAIWKALHPSLVIDARRQHKEMYKGTSSKRAPSTDSTTAGQKS